MNRLETCETQFAAVSAYFDALADAHERLPAANEPQLRRRA
jgi:hypothetical protein